MSPGAQRILAAIILWLIAFGGVSVPVAAATEDLQVMAQAKSAEAVDEALATLRQRVPEWTIPDAVTVPNGAGDLATAAQAATLAEQWVESAYQADQDLPAMQALDRIKDDFESAVSLEQLDAGAALAEQRAQAANAVAAAFARNSEPRDLLENLGLWGTDLQPMLDAVVEAAIAGDVAEAFNKSAEVVDVLNGASASGSLRLAGVGIVLAVLGLSYIFRRQAGPPRSGTGGPPWATAG